MDAITVTSRSGGLLITAISAVLFQTFMSSLKKYTTPPTRVVQQQKVDTYYNIVTSLTHSALSSVGCLYCFYIDPTLSSKIASSYSDFAYLVSCLSLGYFIHDLIHSLKKNSLLSDGGIVLHHVVVIFCFGLSVVQQKFVNYVIVALLCEVNSVFLHMRRLFNMAGVSKGSLCYRLNNLINILTYVFFRICPLSWMCRWLVLHKGLIPDLFHTVGVLGMAIMTVVNVVLFARLLSKDYWRRLGSTSKLPSMKTK